MTEVIRSDVRFSRRLFDGAIGDDKGAFDAFLVRAYKTRLQWKRDTQSEYFADDFADFTADDFDIIDADVRRELRVLLQGRGVYVPKGLGVLISDGLYTVVKNHLRWPQKEKEEEGRTKAATTDAVV